MKQPETREQDPADEPGSSFWPWFAIGVLLFCWIAEATMCAERGF
jgi:hypothetical protein